MLDSAVVLVRRQGASGTSIDDVLADSGAPRGSVYHHFPGGRAQLLEEAVTGTGGLAQAIIDASGEGASPDAVLDGFLASWREGLESSDFRSGCPVLAVAIEHDEDAPQLARAAARVFAAWQQALSSHLRDHGVPPAKARRLSTTMIAAVEGAVALSRTERSTRPLDDVGRELRTLLREALAEQR
jgi:AcrR family transcriptional regulator